MPKEISQDYDINHLITVEYENCESELVVINAVMR